MFRDAGAAGDAGQGLARDTRARSVLIVAGVLSAACGAMIAIDQFRPDDSGFARSFVGALPLYITLVYWGVLASWLAGLATAIALIVRIRRIRDPRLRSRWIAKSQLLIAAELLVPFPIGSGYVIFSNPLLLLGCLPSTLFAVWGVCRMQRYRRMPLQLQLAGFGWGALVATGFGLAMNTLYYANAFSSLVVPKVNQLISSSMENPGLIAGFARWLQGQGPLPPQLHGIIASIQLLKAGLGLDAGIFEELGKGAGVAILFLLYRRWFDGVVSGVVAGATVGLGFNFVETILYMSQGGALFQYWERQSVALMGGHVAFTALIGAGFGVARQLPDRRSRRFIIGCGFLAAMAAHFMNDACLGYLGGMEKSWFAPSPAVNNVVIQPLQLIILQGPFVAMYILLLRRGLRSQAAGLARELGAEAHAGTAAVTAAEIPVLLNPRRRFQLRVLAFRNHGGLDAYRYLGRLQAAQLELAAQRWHSSRQEQDPWAEDETALRARVLQLKRNAPAFGSAAPPLRAEVPA